jgi:hypothetical protein
MENRPPCDGTTLAKGALEMKLSLLSASHRGSDQAMTSMKLSI